MPVLNLNTKDLPVQKIGGDNSPIGKRNPYFFGENTKGDPRRTNLFAIRLMGRSSYIQYMKDIIKNQVSSVDFKVVPNVPEDEEPSEAHIEASESATEFFKGNFNDSNQSFEHLLKIILDDMLDFDGGIVELVPDSEGYLKKILTRDGLTFSKNTSETGELVSEEAYYQFSLSSRVLNHYNISNRKGVDIREMTDELYSLRQAHSIFSEEPKSFPQSRIVWFEENPVSYSSYGRGRTQKVMRQIEMLLKGDKHRTTFFSQNEYHKGVLQSVNASESQLKKLKEKLDASKGDEFTLPAIGGDELNYIQIDPTPEKMQFLESHKWYTKLVLMMFGLNETEAGLHENANRAISEKNEQNIWRRTTSPLLNMIERNFNTEILPFMREYEAVNGELEFKFEVENPAMKKLQQQIDQTDLELGSKTINDIAERQGKEGYGELGDLPKNLFDELVKQMPDYVAEKLGVEDVPEPSQSEPLLSLLEDEKERNNDGNGFTCPKPFDSHEECVSAVRDNPEIDDPDSFCRAWEEYCDNKNLSYPDSYNDLLKN